MDEIEIQFASFIYERCLNIWDITVQSYKVKHKYYTVLHSDWVFETTWLRSYPHAKICHFLLNHDSVVLNQ